MDDPAALTFFRFQTAYREFVSSFDPRQLAPKEREGALAVLAQVQKTAALMGAVTASLMANEPAGRFGFVRPMQARLVASRCAKEWGVNNDEAKRAIDTGARLMAQPEVAKLALAGELSMAQSALVSDAVKADPGAAEFLIKTAKSQTVRGLAIECRRVKAAQAQAAGGAGGGAGGPEPSLEPERSLRSWLDNKGQWHLVARGTREDGERVMLAVDLFAPAPDWGGPDTHNGGAGPQLAPERAFQGLLALAESVGAPSSSLLGPPPLRVGGRERRHPRRSRPGDRPVDEAPPGQWDFDPRSLDWLFASPEEDDPVPGPSPPPDPP